jgi:hypothetical protein
LIQPLKFLEEIEMKQIQALTAMTLAMASVAVQANSVTWTSGSSDGVDVVVQTDLSLTNSAMFGLNAGAMTFCAIDPAVAVFSSTSAGYVPIDWQPEYSSISIDADTHQVLDLKTVGGFAIHAGSVPDVSQGGDISLSNLDFQFDANAVYGSVAGLAADGTEINMASVRLFDILPGAPVDLVQSSPDWWSFDHSFGSLQMTMEASTLFTQALGLTSITGANAAQVFKVFAVGSLNVQVIGPFGGPVTNLPEPASYAMTGLGLLMIGAMTRRGRRG